MKVEKVDKNLYETMLDVMKNNEQYQEDPMVGIFWYDVKNKELFGVNSTIATNLNWYPSSIFNGDDVRTETKLHKNVWQKEFYRKKDNRFLGDYTKVPRGRIFQLKDGTFKVCVGSWIDDYPEAKKLIIDEFQLPLTTEFLKEKHWEVGHGWSNDL